MNVVNYRRDMYYSCAALIYLHIIIYYPMRAQLGWSDWCVSVCVCVCVCVYVCLLLCVWIQK